MLSKIYTIGLRGIEGFVVCCEADIGSGLPQATLIGYLSSAVKESQDRIRTAIKNSGFELSPKKIVINLSPADIRKEGCAYDLPIAIAILRSYGLVAEKHLENSAFVGELSLGGELLPVKGALAIAMSAKDAGFKRLFLPECNLREASVIKGLNCYGIRNLKEAAGILSSDELVVPEVYEYKEEPCEYNVDFADISSQELLKRATILAVAGKHNILYIGPAGTGKSMIASRIPTIMPSMSMEERLDISKLHSICGLLSSDEALIKSRPYRSPHHTISAQALIGGGKYPKPGEVSLASGGVLFLDELTEFKKDVLEVLRQPMEDAKVQISRVNASYTFPASFLLCAATNPCKCGFYPDRSRCSCDEYKVRSYLSKISKPLLDRIDIYVETKLISYDDMKNKKDNISSKIIREQIEEVRQLQLERLKKHGIYFNAQMNAKLIEEYCALSSSDEQFLKSVYEAKGMSLRALHKLLKLARTIADMDKSKNIEHKHICEAIAFRSIEEKYWGNAYGRY